MKKHAFASYEAPFLNPIAIEVEGGFAASLFQDDQTIDAPWFDTGDENLWNF